jgi:sugar lactone lactonase YvrE
LTCSSPGAEPEANKAAFAGACGGPISSHRCELGEGLFISGTLLAWLDIAADRLYISEGPRVQAIDLPVKATVILDCVDDVLVVASAEGLGSVSVSTGVYELHDGTVAALCASSFRTNDGCQLSSGSYLVGTMHASLPAEAPGTVLLLNGGAVQRVIENIFIPNLFVELPEGGVLIADSLQGTIYH